MSDKSESEIDCLPLWGVVRYDIKLLCYKLDSNATIQGIIINCKVKNNKYGFFEVLQSAWELQAND